MLARTALAAVAAMALAATSASAQDTKSETGKAKPAPIERPKAPRDDEVDDGLDLRDFVYSTDESIALFLERLKRTPNDDSTYVRLGEMYERKAEQSGDLDAYEKAEAALRRALELSPENHRAQVALAAVLCSRHKFAEGLELARKALHRKPKDMDALATLGDALLETGRYDDAEKAYRDLAAIARAPAVLARLANLADQKGQTDEALALLTRAIDDIAKSGGTAKETGWFVSVKAEIALNAGRVDEAERLYAGVPSGIDAFHDATAGLARIAAMRGKTDEAIALYEKAVAIGPDPHMLAALGDLYIKAGKADRAAPLFDRLLSLTAGKNEYLRARAIFLADHDRNLAEALALAQKDFVDRKDVLGSDALAWSLYKLGRYDQAARAIADARKLGTKDSNLDFHAGMIHLKLGDRDQARKFLKSALARNPEFSLIHAPVARKALAELGD